MSPPDINTMAGSQHANNMSPAPLQTSTPASRRASQIHTMSPPLFPLASPGGTLLPAGMPHSPGHVQSVDAAVPMRHPRPMTAVEMHMELEREQEAVVNRLTRELNALRAQTASVASNASSNASAHVLYEGTDPSLVGPTHPTTSRRHRSSSSVSRTSNSVPHSSATSFTTAVPSVNASVGSLHQQRHSVSSQANVPLETTGGHGRLPNTFSTPRYEEISHYKIELEEAKKENDRLRARVMELERMVNSRRSSSSDVSRRGRSIDLDGRPPVV